MGKRGSPPTQTSDATSVKTARAEEQQPALSGVALAEEPASTKAVADAKAPADTIVIPEVPERDSFGVESPVSPEEWAKLAIPDTMQKLEVYLNTSMPTSENQGKPLYEHKLLKIEDDVTMSRVSNFK